MNKTVKSNYGTRTNMTESQKTTGRMLESKGYALDREKLLPTYRSSDGLVEVDLDGNCKEL